MDSRIREAIDEIQAIKWLIDEGPAHVKLTEAQVRLADLKDSLAAIDTLAIPAASDARELAVAIVQLSRTLTVRNGVILPPADESARLIEAFAADRERKAREETARKCVEAAVRFFNLAPAGELANDFIRRIMEAAHE